jgi:hypothetical protein
MVRDPACQFPFTVVLLPADAGGVAVTVTGGAVMVCVTLGDPGSAPETAPLLPTTSPIRPNNPAMTAARMDPPAPDQNWL